MCRENENAALSFSLSRRRKKTYTYLYIYNLYPFQSANTAVRKSNQKTRKLSLFPLDYFFLLKFHTYMTWGTSKSQENTKNIWRFGCLNENIIMIDVQQFKVEI